MKRAVVAVAAALALGATGLAIAAPQSKNGNGAPRYVVDPFWPKPLPDNWILGQVAGIAVDSQDNVWIVHRPATLVDDEKGAQKNSARDALLHSRRRRCWSSTPDGRLLRSWGGPGRGLRLAEERARHPRRQGGQRLARRQRQGRPDPEVHARRQVPAADRQGRHRRRLQQHDAARPAGAHGDGRRGRTSSTSPTATATAASSCSTPRPAPTSGTGAPTAPRRRATTSCRPTSRWRHRAVEAFANPVHCVRLSRDGLVYVCDRANNRIQVFQQGRHVREGVPASSRRRCRTARCGTWCCRRTRRSATSSSPTAPTCQVMTHRPPDRREAFAASAARAAWPASSSGCTTWRSTRKGNHLHRRGRRRPARAEVQAARIDGPARGFVTSDRQPRCGIMVAPTALSGLAPPPRVAKTPAFDPWLFRGSSAVEQPAVNRLVVGSNPTRGANDFGTLTSKRRVLGPECVVRWMRRSYPRYLLCRPMREVRPIELTFRKSDRRTRQRLQKAIFSAAVSSSCLFVVTNGRKRVAANAQVRWHGAMKNMRRKTDFAFWTFIAFAGLPAR